MKRSRGRVFYSYLVSFALILAIPIVLSIVVFQRASSTVAAEVNRVSMVLEVQTRKYLDSVAGDFLQLSQLLVNNPHLESLALRSGSPGDDEYYAAYHLVAEARTYRAISSAVVDFYVYLPAIDLVVTPEGFYSAATYHRSWVSHQGVTLDQWSTSFAEIRDVQYRSGTHLYPATAEPRTSVIEIVTPIRPRAAVSEPRGWVVVQVREDLLSSPFADTEWADSAVFIVHSAESGVVASSNRALSERLLAEAGLDPVAIASQSVVETSAASYVPLGFRSKTSTLYYLTLLPVDTYRRQLSSLRRFAVIAFVVAGAVGSVVVFASAHARYRPIRDLVELVSRPGDSVVTLQGDEFRLITDALESTLAEQRTMRTQARRHREIVRERMLRQILTGALDDSSASRLDLHRYGMELTAGFVVIALLDSSGSGGISPPVGKCIEALRSLQPACGTVTVLDVGGKIGALLTGLPSADEGPTTEWAQLARARLLALSSGECAVGLSAVHSVQDSLPEIYHEALSALEYRLVRGSETPIRYDEVNTGAHAYFYPIETETKLVNSIAAGEVGAARAIIQGVFQQNFSAGTLSIEMARCLMFDLISTMVKTLNSIEPIERDVEFWTRVSPIRRLTQCQSLEELRVLFDEVIERVCRHVRASRTPHAVQLLKLIDTFISENLSDPNLGPDSIGAAIERSGAYTARFFREQRGVGLSAFIKELRVNAAKGRLAETETPVHTLGEALGFSGASAFVRAFKEREGIPPGEYRDSLRT